MEVFHGPQLFWPSQQNCWLVSCSKLSWIHLTFQSSTFPWIINSYFHSYTESGAFTSGGALSMVKVHVFNLICLFSKLFCVALVLPSTFFQLQISLYQFIKWAKQKHKHQNIRTWSKAVLIGDALFMRNDRNIYLLQAPWLDGSKLCMLVLSSIYYEVLLYIIMFKI